VCCHSSINAEITSTAVSETAAPGGRLTYLKSLAAKLLLRCSERRHATVTSSSRQRPASILGTKIPYCLSANCIPQIQLSDACEGKPRTQTRPSPAPLLSLCVACAILKSSVTTTVLRFTTSGSHCIALQAVPSRDLDHRGICESACQASQPFDYAVLFPTK